MEPDDEQKRRIEYVRDVMAAFARKSGSTRPVSNLEYDLIRSWALPVKDKAGDLVRGPIPVRIVLRAIEDFEGTPRRVEALVHPVERAYAYWVKALS